MPSSRRRQGRGRVDCVGAQSKSGYCEWWRPAFVPAAPHAEGARARARLHSEIEDSVLSFAVMKALIIDETGQISRRLHPALEQESYVVETANSRGEARWLAGDSDADVVIVCSARPGLHDVPTVEALREDGESAPILVLARRADSEDVVAALDAGADDVVVSPVPFAEIVARLRALTRRPAEMAHDVLQVGTLPLDRATHRVTRVDPVCGAEWTLDLRTREYALLELLMRHPGQVLSKARIVDHVWGPETDGSPNVVEQVVSRLRSKVDRPFGREDLVTVRGVGYRLIDSAPQENTSLLGRPGDERRPETDERRALVENESAPSSRLMPAGHLAQQELLAAQGEVPICS